MRINITLVLDDDQLRRVRASWGRGGRATRAELRVWLQGVVDTAIAATPAPKVRRKLPRADPPPATRSRAIDTPLPLTDDSRCGACGRRLENHGRMSQTCPPGFGAPLGSRFTPAEE